MKAHHFLAFDLGAESGRAVLGTLDGGRLLMRELCRFSNGLVRILGHLHWNLPSLFEEVKRGVRTCTQEVGLQPESLAMDTWGVDFGLLAEDGSLLGLPFAYRDHRTSGAMEEFFKRMPRHEVYALTGIQFMPFNSLFQLYAMVRDRSSLLEAARSLLFMPDLFHYLLTGRQASEFTMATTSQLYNPRRRTWSAELFSALGLPESLMQDVLDPGTVIGPVLEDVAVEVGLASCIPVMATASHDTGSAVAAVPAAGQNWAYISSGTWSLMGIEAPQPIINSQTLRLNFTNEGGLAGRIRFLKNVTGLWLLARCRAAWEAERTSALDYGGLVRAAEMAGSFQAFIDPDAEDFLNPSDMPAAIRGYAERTGQKAPDSVPAYVRCILESLALKYRLVLSQLRQVSPSPIEKVHIIGGGSQNALLNQFTAEATGLPVIAGPTEATAYGNILGQALGLGHVRSPEEVRAIVRTSCDLETYEPQNSAAWDKAFDRFVNIIGLPR